MQDRKTNKKPENCFSEDPKSTPIAKWIFEWQTVEYIPDEPYLFRMQTVPENEIKKVG